MSELPHKRQHLSEDEYLERVSEIIQHDYFPNLRKYRYLARYLEAVESKDTRKAKKVASEFAEPEKPLPSLCKFMKKYKNEDNLTLEAKSSDSKKSELIYFPKAITYNQETSGGEINFTNTQAPSNSSSKFFVIYKQMNKNSTTLKKSLTETIKFRKSLSFCRLPSRNGSIFSKSQASSQSGR